MATTDDVSTLIEGLQFTLGKGPCIDACRLDRPVLEPTYPTQVAGDVVVF